ncbi:hypothetical protein D3C80_1524620 [compost metagenome]
MNFKNEFVAHGKIYFLNFASIKSNGSKSYIINFCFAESTIIKNTIDKSNCQKGAGRKVTIIKNAAFEVLKI